MRNVLLFLFAILLVSLNLSGPVKAENSSLNVGSPVPLLELPTLAGGTFNTLELRGKPFILTFYSTWSQTCLEDLKFLQTLKEKFSSLKIVAVSFDNKASSVSSFLKKHDLSFISLIDKKQTCLDEFQILVIPTSYLVDADGILRNMYVSFDDLIRGSMTADVELALNPPKDEE